MLFRSEISAGSVKNSEIEKKTFDEWDQPQCPIRDGDYEFYNVLWIEWVDGIAYRKALGRVEKTAWDAAATKIISVTLG